ncbi:MAG: SRPBCC family protein [Actinomycetota bacterium]|jgi:uncharacterized membrane protein|nr:SRPBCC family protein [Actinomycetota bacterium]MDA3015911.1 SRPBCC family protein [Actinomycetota bacterium]MDA3028994.1 SRPBCC family protein [Actinomycetota bacterium]
MADRASDTIIIEAPLTRVWEIAADIERYPEWALDVKQVVVTEHDEEGRPFVVEFRASALGRSTHYTLRYDYSEAPNRLSWTMVSGDIQRNIDGAYVLADLGGGRTEVRYDLSIDLVVPLPGFVKRRAERRILNAIRELKVVAER